MLHNNMWPEKQCTTRRTHLKHVTNCFLGLGSSGSHGSRLLPDAHGRAIYVGDLLFPGIARTDPLRFEVFQAFRWKKKQKLRCKKQWAAFCIWKINEPWTFNEPWKINEPWTFNEPWKINEPWTFNEPWKINEPWTFNEPWKINEPWTFNEPWKINEPWTCNEPCGRAFNLFLFNHSAVAMSGASVRFTIQCKKAIAVQRNICKQLSEAVVPNRGAAVPCGATYSAQGCREIMRFFTISLKIHFQTVIKPWSKLLWVP